MKKLFIIIISLVAVASIIAIAIFYSQFVKAAGCCDCEIGICCLNVGSSAGCSINACLAGCGGFDIAMYTEGYTCSGGMCVPEFKDYLQMSIAGVLILGACLFVFRRKDK